MLYYFCIASYGNHTITGNTEMGVNILVNTVLEVSHCPFIYRVDHITFQMCKQKRYRVLFFYFFVNMCCIYVVDPKLNEVASLLMDAVPVISLGIVIDQIQNFLQYILFFLFPQMLSNGNKQHRKKQYSA